MQFILPSSIEKMKRSTKKRSIRFGAMLVSITIIGAGLIPLFLKKDLFYSNWWGGLVFAPLPLLVGIFLLYLVVFKWDKIEKM
jgi:hypothetical protein